MIVATACAAAAPRPSRPRVARPAVVRAAPSPPPVEPPGVSYDELVAAETVADTRPLATERLGPGTHALHVVLDAGRCYRVVAVGEGGVAASLLDEHTHVLADERGRVVRLAGVCPRWTGSFLLRLDLEGARGQVWLYEDSISSNSPVSSPTAR